LRGGVGADDEFEATAGALVGGVAGLGVLLERKKPENKGVVLRGGAGAGDEFAATAGLAVEVVAGLEVLLERKRPSNNGVGLPGGTGALDVLAETTGAAAGGVGCAGEVALLEPKRPSNKGFGLLLRAGNDALLATGGEATGGEATAVFGTCTGAALGVGSDGLRAQDEDISVNTTMGLGRRITKGFKGIRACMERKKCAGLIAKTL
jgi:hypothetical protein